MEKVEATITFKHWDEKVSITVDHSDITIEEFHDLCKRLAMGAGYSEKTVEKYFQ